MIFSLNLPILVLFNETPLGIEDINSYKMDCRKTANK